MSTEELYTNKEHRNVAIILGIALHRVNAALVAAGIKVDLSQKAILAKHVAPVIAELKLAGAAAREFAAVVLSIYELALEEAKGPMVKVPLISQATSGEPQEAPHVH